MTTPLRVDAQVRTGVEDPVTWNSGRRGGPPFLATPSLIAETMRAKDIRASSRASF
jgi:hypothetical protein